MSEVASVTGGSEFSGRATQNGTVITAVLRGSADYAAVDALDLMLQRIHAASARQPITEAVIDLRQLEFMNSACFKCFVSWVTQIDLDDKHRYQVRFISNPSFHWQKRSLHSLRCFAVELITITEK